METPKNKLKGKSDDKVKAKKRPKESVKKQDKGKQKRSSSFSSSLPRRATPPTKKRILTPDSIDDGMGNRNYYGRGENKTYGPSVTYPHTYDHGQYYGHGTTYSSREESNSSSYDEDDEKNYQPPRKVQRVLYSSSMLPNPIVKKSPSIVSDDDQTSRSVFSKPTYVDTVLNDYRVDENDNDGWLEI